MKTLLLALLALALGTTATTAKTLEITVDAIRSDKGQILAMATVAGQKQPFYGKADAKKGSVVITLTGIETDTAEVSLFHDEDGDFQMKMGDRGPQEGYAKQKSLLPNEANKTTLKIHYPQTAAEQSK